MQRARRRCMHVQALQAAARAIDGALATVFMLVTGPLRPLVLRNEYLLATACTALGLCAPWLAARRDAALGNIMALCVSAVLSGHPPRVCPEACTALRQLCSQPVSADVLPLQDAVTVRGAPVATRAAPRHACMPCMCHVCRASRSAWPRCVRGDRPRRSPRLSASARSRQEPRWQRRARGSPAACWTSARRSRARRCMHARSQPRPSQCSTRRRGGRGPERRPQSRCVHGTPREHACMPPVHTRACRPTTARPGAG
jgi:hypothetical protein